MGLCFGDGRCDLLGALSSDMVKKYFLFLFFLWPSTVYACPACSDLISRGKDALSAMKFGEGVSFSIYFMFLIPIILMLSMGFVFYRSYQKSQKQKPV